MFTQVKVNSPETGFKLAGIFPGFKLWFGVGLMALNPISNGTGMGSTGGL